jgi:hypothetical protein
MVIVHWTGLAVRAAFCSHPAMTVAFSRLMSMAAAVAAHISGASAPGSFNALDYEGQGFGVMEPFLLFRTRSF